MSIYPLVNVMKPRRIAPIEKFTEYLAATHHHAAMFYDGIYFQTQQQPMPHMVGNRPHDVFTVFPSYCPDGNRYEYLGLGSMTKDVRLTPKGQKFQSDGSDQVITVFEITEHDIDAVDKLVIERIREREEEERIKGFKDESPATKV
ncbi:MAG TPA: hypothetical protein VJH90_01380 [archaeon]|nr:hypothetical protein [archaeon]